ncbi:diguanylate cyclase [Bacillus sp. FJAT-49732]|uniref:Diguanylate cyclase n=1 Tax=Lederbergia citrisecunda TaxID=2833583 RepID=A0A942TQN4_9BACI|nr:diguanylate cyclase [Lederbergia citrisecunda]MBS4201132.1 diguanylate cyclase [Lederbergia citrisecunda]
MSRGAIFNTRSLSMDLLNQTILDSLIDQIAVVDKDGFIISVNKSWIDFSNKNQGDLSTNGIGKNYLDVCQDEVKQGIQSILQKGEGTFTFEYPCHSNTEKRWFLLRATPFLFGNGDYGAIISHVNITDRKLTELELSNREQRYRLIAEYSTDFISIHSSNGVFTYVSPICRPLLGFDASELLGKHIYEFLHPKDIEKISVAFEKKDIITVSYRIRCKNGKYIWFETKSQKVLASNGDDEEILCISRDVTKQRMKLLKLETEKELLQRTINLDELTGVYNRRLLNKELKRHCKNVVKHNVELSLLIVDIDYFKQYNDTYGHQQGDQCLIAVANTLTKNVRESDIVCRIGGEEFCILLPNTNKEIATSLAKRLCREIANLKIEHVNSNTSRFVTISIGVSSATKGTAIPSDGKKLISLADQALYKAKEQGKNRFVYL